MSLVTKIEINWDNSAAQTWAEDWQAQYEVIDQQWAEAFKRLGTEMDQSNKDWAPAWKELLGPKESSWTWRELIQESNEDKMEIWSEFMDTARDLKEQEDELNKQKMTEAVDFIEQAITVNGEHIDLIKIKADSPA